jgi:hypothetical protein
MKEQSHSIDEVIDFCQQHSLNSIMIGKWIWVKFACKPADHMLKLLKGFGFCWSSRRGMWAHNCGHPSQPGKQAPWHKYRCCDVSGSVQLED